MKWQTWFACSYFCMCLHGYAHVHICLGTEADTDYLLNILQEYYFLRQDLSLKMDIINMTRQVNESQELACPCFLNAEILEVNYLFLLCFLLPFSQGARDLSSGLNGCTAITLFTKPLPYSLDSNFIFLISGRFQVMAGLRVLFIVMRRSQGLNCTDIYLSLWMWDHVTKARHYLGLLRMVLDVETHFLRN